MAGDNLVEVRFGANTADLRRGAAEAAGAVDGIRDRLKEFKSETVQTGRQARFFANELAAIIPGADGAKAALRDLIAVGLSGSAIGAAIEGVKLIATVLYETAEAARKTKEELKKIGDDISSAFERIKLSLVPSTDTEAAWRAWYKKVKEEQLDPIEKKLKDLAEASKLIGILLPTDDLEKQKADLLALIEAKKKERDATEAVEVATKDQQEFDKRATAAMLESATHFQQEKKKLYQQGEKDALEGLQRLLDAQEKAALDDARIVAEQMKELKKHNDEVTKQTTDSLQAFYDAQDKRTKAVTQSLSHAFKTAFHEIIDGTKSVGDALLGMLRNIGEAIVDSLLNKIAEAAAALVTKGITHAVDVSESEGNIAVAATGAAAAVADIPIVGPALAVAAAQMVRDNLQSMADPLLSAAGGLDRVPGAEQLIVAHRDETVLPASLAEAYRRGAQSLQGGTGGGTGGGYGGPPIHIHALDGESVMRVVRSYEFRRAVAESRRLGES